MFKSKCLIYNRTNLRMRTALESCLLSIETDRGINCHRICVAYVSIISFVCGLLGSILLKGPHNNRLCEWIRRLKVIGRSATVV